MKKNGFTLAEVLVTLGIIGIVAALSLPSLMNLKREAGMGPLLAKTQATVEEAVGRMMLEFPDTPLADYGDENFAKEMQKHILWTSGGGGYRLKDGVVISFTDPDEGATMAVAGGSPFKKVSVDLNGNEGKPNTAGVDKFEFLLSSKGSMVPQGCAAKLASNNWKAGKDYDTGTCSDYVLGEDIQDPCAEVTCPAGQKCVGGNCVEIDLCENVNCGPCQTCVDGECVYQGDSPSGCVECAIFDTESCSCKCPTDLCPEGEKRDDATCCCVDDPDYCPVAQKTAECSALNKTFDEASCDCGGCKNGFVDVGSGCVAKANCDSESQYYIEETNTCGDKKECWDGVQTSYVMPDEVCPLCKTTCNELQGLTVNLETCECEFTGCPDGTFEVTNADGSISCMINQCVGKTVGNCESCDPATGEVTWKALQRPEDCDNCIGMYWDPSTCRCKKEKCCYQLPEDQRDGSVPCAVCCANQEYEEPEVPEPTIDPCEGANTVVERSECELRYTNPSTGNTGSTTSGTTGNSNVTNQNFKKDTTKEHEERNNADRTKSEEVGMPSEKWVD